MQKNKILSSLNFCSFFIICFGFFISVKSAPPYMVYLNFNNTPSAILNNLSANEALPFDGFALTLSSSSSVLTNTAQSYTTMYNEVLPLKGKLSKLNNCWILVSIANSGDWFNNWSTCIQNFANVARVCKDFELEGIMFDPEGAYDTWNYDKQAQASTKTFNEYRAQAIVQGKAIMQACVKEYPTLKIVTLHGPYISEPKCPAYVTMGSVGIFEAQNYLLGAFFTGWLEGIGTQGMVIDGGEVYQYRTEEHFKMSYDWRKYTIASATNNSPNIPVADRAIWPTKVSIGYGFLPNGWPDGYTMTPEIMRTSVENGLRKTDYMSWWYGGTGADYMSALSGAIDAVKNGIEFTSPTLASVKTGDKFGYKAKYINKTGTSVKFSVIKKPAWINQASDSLYGTAPTTISCDTVIAVVTSGSKLDSLILVVYVSAYLQFEAEKCAVVAPLQIISDVKASGGQCITSTTGSGNNIFTTGVARATYSVYITQPASYYVWALISSVAGFNNVGTFTGFGGKYDKVGLKTVGSGAYEWVKSPTAYPLLAGNNIFNIINGNEQARVDKIIITNSADVFLPPVIQTSIEKNEVTLKTNELNLTLNKTNANNLEFLVSVKNEQAYNFKLINVAGKTIFSKNVADGKRNSYINLSAKVNSGLYLAVLQQGTNILNKKVVIVK